jgi:hypothetical protein
VVIQQHHYMTVISPGPLMIVRVPWPMPRWRELLRASTTLMRAHGLRQKDISAFDGMVPSDPTDREAKDWDLASRLDAAYAGATDKFPRFWLYDWRDGSFRLARAPTEAT